jgi:hypothetical protein
MATIITVAFFILAAAGDGPKRYGYVMRRHE